MKAQKFGAGSNDDDDDGLEEESLLETPLDHIEPYGLFKSTLLRKTPFFLLKFSSLTNSLFPTEMQQGQPQLYDTLTKVLNPEEQQVVQSVVIQADAIMADLAAQANGGIH